MQILLVNPNTTVGVTTLLGTAARAVAAPDTVVKESTAPRGFPYVSSRAEAQIAGAIALETICDGHLDVDAVIVAAFGDPGLHAARELFAMPVVGMSEAAMLTACMLGRTFGIVTFASALSPWYEDCVASTGLASRCTGVSALEEPFTSIDTVQDEKEHKLVDLCLSTLGRQPADVLILGGAPLAGLASRISARVPVPLIDPIQAAIKQAEALVALKPHKASAGSFRRPIPKLSTGLPAPLAAWLAHRPL